MSRTTTMTARLCGPLSEFVAANVGEDGAYDNVGEHIPDHIRCDRALVEREAFERLKAELRAAFAAPELSCEPLTAG